MNHELNLTTFRYEKSDMEAIKLINWILITFKLKDKLKLKLEEIMDFLIENKNNANQNFKFLTIIMNYPNFKKILTFPLSTKIAQTNTKKKSNLPN